MIANKPFLKNIDGVMTEFILSYDNPDHLKKTQLSIVNSTLNIKLDSSPKNIYENKLLPGIDFIIIMLIIMLVVIIALDDRIEFLYFYDINTSSSEPKSGDTTSLYLSMIQSIPDLSFILPNLQTYFDMLVRSVMYFLKGIYYIKFPVFLFILVFRVFLVFFFLKKKDQKNE